MKLCECGCGQPTEMAKKTRESRGHIAGEPLRYINHHHARKTWGNFVEDAETDCWVWRGSQNGKGYGMLMLGRRRFLAHRVYYEQMVGPIPDGLEIDHVCRNRACVNPGHLEPVTRTENCRRSPLIGRMPGSRGNRGKKARPG